MVDIFARLEKNAGGPIGQYMSYAHGYFAFPKLEGEIGPHMVFRGKKMLNWSLNNYLGLANHPEVRKADAEGAAEFGMAAPMGARMMSGQTKYHERLERELAEFVGKEDAFLLNFGYQGMLSIIDCLLTPRDVVVYDAEAHACIIDGLRLHKGKRFVYGHNDMDSLRLQLKHATELAEEQNGGVLVITEGVFGMKGDLGKLDEIVALKKDFQFRLLVDDAHGFGTMGEGGRGTASHFGVVDGVDVRQYPLGQLRGKLGIVPQKAVLFSGSLRKNLCWRKKDASDEEIWAALETAQAREFVEKLPDGLDTQVDQGGQNFSGGQRQRLTIARALVGHPEVLILDDSASALDFATDAALRRAIARDCKEMTVLLVSQRASTVRQAEQILVLDDGRMAGTGTHEKLLQSCPLYREICLSQGMGLPGEGSVSEEEGGAAAWKN